MSGDRFVEIDDEQVKDKFFNVNVTILFVLIRIVLFLFFYVFVCAVLLLLHCVNTIFLRLSINCMNKYNDFYETNILKI